MGKSDMFYGASASIFAKAKNLRSNMTQSEQLLWGYLNNNQLRGCRFRRQHPIHVFIADFYCHTAKLVIELDGGIHDISEQKEYDSGRTYEIESFGLTVIRFTNEQLTNDLPNVLNQIMKCLP
jgi:very-short-patch-repair endonuclease